MYTPHGIYWIKAVRAIMGKDYVLTWVVAPEYSITSVMGAPQNYLLSRYADNLLLLISK